MSNTLFCINCEYCFGQKAKVSLNGATSILKFPKTIKCHHPHSRWQETLYISQVRQGGKTLTTSPEACHLYRESEK